MTDPTITGALAAWVSDLTYEDIPVAVRERVKDLFLDALASGLAGNSGDEIDQIDEVARGLGGDSDESTVLARHASTPVGAALMNGYLITAATVCDVHRPTLCHVTPEVVPPALVVAEQRDATGRDLIVALAAGLETTTRIGVALDYPVFRRHGWHSPGVIGPFGGAAAAGRLLGLDAVAQCNALGLAGSQAAGTFAHWGTPTIKFHQSRGALSGLLAATLAATGFQASPDILAAQDGGLFTSYAEGGRPEAVVDRLGDHWELMNISLRLWPVASSIQSMVTALFAALAERPLEAASIESIRIGLSETVYRMHGELGWDSRFRALLSARYVASVVVHDQACWLDQFTPERIADPKVDAFARDRIRVEVDPKLATNAAVVEVRTTDGQASVVQRDAPRGDSSDPLSRDEILDKFRRASAPLMTEGEADRVSATATRLEEAPGTCSLIRAFRADHP